MDKEELLKLMSEERPSQNLIEIIDFRPSECGIEGVLYDVDVEVKHNFIYESSYTKTHYNMPYPLKPYKDHNDKKVDIMLKSLKHPIDYKDQYEEALVSLLSIYDRLSKVDNECIASGIDLPEWGLRKNETLTEMFFRILENNEIDLNKELGFTHLKPVKKPK